MNKKYNFINPGDYNLGSVLKLNNPNIFYINHNSFANAWWESGTVNLQFIEFLKDYRFVIIDLSSEHWGDPSDNLTISVEENLKSAGIKNFLIITHLIEDHKKTPNIVFCPTEYHTSRESFKSESIQKAQQNLLETKIYPLSCLNNNCWPHRIYYATTIYQKDWFDKILFTAYEIAHDNSHRPDQIVLDKNTLDIWNQIKSKYRIYFPGNIWSLDNPAYLNSYTNLAIETVVSPGVYLSEKTWKPIACGMWFLILGCPGTIAHLRSLGVDVFDDIFDHSYDLELDFFKRVDKLNQVVDNYIKKDYKSLWIKTANRRLANSKKFLDGLFDQKYLAEIKSTIEQYAPINVA